MVSGAGEKLRKREENVWRKKQTRLVKKKKNTVGKRSKIFGGEKSDDKKTNRISSCTLDRPLLWKWSSKKVDQCS